MIKPINRVSGRYYAIYLLTEHCMPVLLGLKPSNIITAHKKKVVNQDEFIDCIYKEVLGFRCRLSILFESDNVYILLIYKYNLMKEILSKEANYRFLRKLGYGHSDNTVEKYIDFIRRRYYRYKEGGAPFPHEIGILLGYPLEDVKGFIENHGRSYLLNGYWKVYGDVKQAKETFHLYQMARELGRSIFTNLIIKKDFNI